MNLTADDSEKQKILIPEGLHKARCYAIIDRGTILNRFGDVKRTLQISWEVPEVTHIFNKDIGPQPLSIHKSDYNMSFNKKANLRKDLENWRNVKYKDGESVPLYIYLNAPASLQIFHGVGKASGKPYHAIGNISMVDPQLRASVPNASNKLLYLDLSPEGFRKDEMQFKVGETILTAYGFNHIPEWMKEEIAKTDEYKELIEKKLADVYVKDQSSQQHQQAHQSQSTQPNQSAVTLPSSEIPVNNAADYLEEDTSDDIAF